MKFVATLVLACLASAQAMADCPAKPPKIDWNIYSGDQRVDAGYLQGLLPGKKVRFSAGGVEHYRPNGKYRYSGGGRTYDADSYRFYKNGVRCIGYSEPRFDLYVMNKGKLVLVNAVGTRYKAKVK